MPNPVDEFPTSIAEILRDVALDEDCEELAQIADYVDDMEDLLAYYRDTAKVLHEYATKYARMKAGLRILAGEGKNKIQDLDHMNKFARYVIEHADAYSVE